MVSARDSILGRLRMSGATARLPHSDPLALQPLPRRSINDCVRRFRQEAELLGVECFVEDSAEYVRARLESIIAGRRLLSWDPEQLPHGAGALVGSATLGRAARADQADAEVGVTGCDAAIAETASLVMLSGPGRSRTASLLPPVHVALVQRDQFCFSLGEFFATSRARLRQSPSCTLITGPSRTADIELTLTLGIHGPGRVLVIVGPDS